MPALIELGLTNALVAAVLGLVVAVVSRFCRRPALVHCLWLLVLLKLVTPPFVRPPLGWLERNVESTNPAAPAVDVASTPMIPGPSVWIVEMPPAAPGVEQAAPPFELVPIAPQPPAELIVEPRQGPLARAESSLAETAAPGALPWKPMLVGGWAAGSALWVVLAIVRARRFGRLLRSAWPAPEAVQAQAEELAASLGLRRPPGLWMVTGAVSPMLWALGGPARLVLPQALWKTLDDDQRAALLVHELAHYKRRDHWVRHLELLVTGLYWWHPVVWWARGALREAEEQCCDAWVVSTLPDSARSYAMALVQTLEFLADARPGLPVAASGVGHLTSLKRRLTMIMQATTPRSLSRLGWMAMLGLAATLLPLAPSWAQRPAPEPSVSVAPSPDVQPQPQPRPVLADQVAQGELAIARLELERAQEQYERARKMYEKGYVSKGQKADEEIAVERARLALQVAESRLTPSDDKKPDDDKDGDQDQSQNEAKQAEHDKAEANLQKLQKQLHEFEAKNLPEIEKARRALDKLMGDYHQKQQDLQQRVMEAQRRLAEAQGRKVFVHSVPGGAIQASVPVTVAPRVSLPGQPGQPATTYYVVPQQNQPQIVGQPPSGPVVTPFGAAPDTERRLSELERKLDRLLGEFERLKDGDQSPRNRTPSQNIP